MNLFWVRQNNLSVHLNDDVHATFPQSKVVLFDSYHGFIIQCPYRILQINYVDVDVYFLF